MDACGAALRLAGLSPWIVYRSWTCRAALQSEAFGQKVKLLFLTEDSG